MRLLPILPIKFSTWKKTDFSPQLQFKGDLRNTINYINNTREVQQYLNNKN